VRQTIMTHECDNLDAYLANEMPGAAAARFAQHLNECSACRQAVDQQRWIDSLLQSKQLAVLEPVPMPLHEALRTSLAQRRRQARLIAFSAASIAATVLIAVGWTVTQNREAANLVGNDGNRTVQGRDLRSTNSSPAMVTSDRAPQSTFVSNENAIAVPLDSQDYDVTVVQVYLTTESQRRIQRDLSYQYIQSMLNGG
jgi:hypothetical protein